MTIIGCMFYITLGVFLGFVFWLVSDIKEAVENKKATTAKTATTKTATTTKTTVTTTRNREYYVHGGIVYDPNGNPI